MPLQCSTQWDGLGHIFDHGMAWNGRPAQDVVTSDGDLVTGIEHLASPVVSRGVLLDVGRVVGDRRGAPRRVRHHRGPPDGNDCRTGPTAAVGRGDIVLVRTGRLARARREGWNDYAGGPVPRAVVLHRRLVAPHRDRRDRHGHLGIRGPAQRVPRTRSSRCTRWSSRTWACSSARCGTSTRSPTTAPQTASTSSCSPLPPLKITGAVGAPLNPLAVK